MAQYKLYYFNMRGRGELIRLLFAASGQQYEDIRMEQSEWPEYKKQAPFGQAPFLEIENGKKKIVLSQSCAIARYLSRKFGLAGKGDEEQALVEMYGDQMSDLVNEMSKSMRESDENKKKEFLDKFQTETLPFHMKLYDSRIAESKSGFLFPSGMTWADLYLFGILDFLSEAKEQIFQIFPFIKVMEEKVRNHSKMAAYLAKRPDSDM
nr:glutathione S-transferase sigma 3-1 [Brachionus rubens]